MRKLSAIEIEISQAQEALFEYASETGLDMDTFTEEFMRSVYANHFLDNTREEFAFSLQDAWNTLSPELSLKKAIQRDDKDWGQIGAVYRELQIVTGKGSEALYGHIKPTEMIHFLMPVWQEDREWEVDEILKALSSDGTFATHLGLCDTNKPE